MLTFQRKAVPMIAAAAGTALLIGACSSGKSGSGAYGGSTGKSSPSPSNAASPTGAARAATSVTATETEFKIALSQSTFKPGTYTFTVVNKGKYPHNLTVAGPGITSKASPTLQGGGTGALTVTLKAGSYELWCAVDSHKDKGMDVKIAVA